MKLSMNPGQVPVLSYDQYPLTCFCQGDIYADPALLLPTVADKKNLAAVYDIVSIYMVQF